MVSPTLLQEGYILGRLPGKREENQDLQFTFDIAFGEPDVFAGRPVLETLNQIGLGVQSILNHFAAIR